MQGAGVFAVPSGMHNDRLHAMYNERFHVFFSGKVQGVGFRRTLRTHAMELKLVGWVKNLEDGRVEAVAEGTERPFHLLVEKVCSEFEVTQAEIVREPAAGGFSSFEIVK
ncbi:MAG: hypothetical protein RLZZ165_2133 [Bacteroidota bacterium]